MTEWAFALFPNVLIGLLVGMLLALYGERPQAERYVIVRCIMLGFIISLIVGLGWFLSIAPGRFNDLLLLLREPHLTEQQRALVVVYGTMMSFLWMLGTLALSAAFVLALKLGERKLRGMIAMMARG